MNRVVRHPNVKKPKTPEVPKKAIVEVEEGEPKVVLVAVMTYLARHADVEPRRVIQIPYDEQTKQLLAVGDYRFPTLSELKEFAAFKKRGEEEDYEVELTQYVKPTGSPVVPTEIRSMMDYLTRMAAAGLPVAGHEDGF